jgi:hypothetical protein
VLGGDLVWDSGESSDVSGDTCAETALVMVGGAELVAVETVHILACEGIC